MKRVVPNSNYANSMVTIDNNGNPPIISIDPLHMRHQCYHDISTNRHINAIKKDRAYRQDEARCAKKTPWATMELLNLTIALYKICRPMVWYSKEHQFLEPPKHVLWTLFQQLLAATRTEKIDGLHVERTTLTCDHDLKEKLKNTEMYPKNGPNTDINHQAYQLLDFSTLFESALHLEFLLTPHSGFLFGTRNFAKYATFNLSTVTELNQFNDLVEHFAISRCIPPPERLTSDFQQAHRAKSQLHQPLPVLKKANSTDSSSCNTLCGFDSVTAFSAKFTSFSSVTILSSTLPWHHRREG